MGVGRPDRVHNLFPAHIFLTVGNVVGNGLVEEKSFSINVSRSREAIDELKRLGGLTPEERGKLNKIIGFHNILVYDYLNVNEDITQAIITKQDYTFVIQIAEKLMRLLDEKG